jgi:hypothetical protein
VAAKKSAICGHLGHLLRAPPGRRPISSLSLVGSEPDRSSQTVHENLIYHEADRTCCSLVLSGTKAGVNVTRYSTVASRRLVGDD